MARRPRHVPLRVLLNNRLVGRLTKAATGAIDFRYEADWLGWEHAISTARFRCRVLPRTRDTALRNVPAS